ncbi:hypothetical protein J2747_001883 [Thermococcus stetteri]|nr:hypothetical protein [Thermococcus stetteri]
MDEIAYMFTPTVDKIVLSSKLKMIHQHHLCSLSRSVGKSSDLLPASCSAPRQARRGLRDFIQTQVKADLQPLWPGLRPITPPLGIQATQVRGYGFDSLFKILNAPTKSALKISSVAGHLNNPRTNLAPSWGFPQTGQVFEVKASLTSKNPNTMLFGDFLEPLNHSIETPDVGEEIILLFTLVRVSCYSLWITDNYSGDAPLVELLNGLPYRH